MHLSRRLSLAAVASAAALALAGCGSSAAASGGSSSAADKDPDQIVFASIPSESATSLEQQYGTVIKVLEKTTGKKITFQNATDYAAVIEGMKAGKIQIAAFGPLSYVEARNNGVYVIYSLFPSPKPATFPNPKISDYVPELAPKGDEPVVTAFVDKFMLGDKDTGLQKLLTDRGIKTLIPVGVSSHNGVLFTSVMASLRGFDVVVPVDGMAGNNAYEDQATDYILTNSIVYKATLTSIDRIKFAK